LEKALTSSKVDQRRDFSRSFRIAVEIVRHKSHRSDHDAEHIQTPEKGSQHIMVSILECEAQSDEASDHKRCAKPDDLEADLRFEVSVMLLDVALSNTIMKPMTADFAENSGNDWCKVKEPDLFWPEVVERSQEDCEGCIDANYPSESEAVVGHGKENSRLDQYPDGAHAGLSKSIAKVTGTVLRDTNELLELRASDRLVNRIDGAVVIRLFNKTDCQNQDKSILFGSADVCG
jgi:hypothetical protein